jgi:hypothetical protein
MNAAPTGERYILGGAWNVSGYLFSAWDARTPFARDETFGFRLVKRTAALPDVAAGSLALVNPVPPPTAVDDDTYRLYAALHRYDKQPLDSKVGLTDDSSQRSSCVSKLSSSPRGASWETIRPRSTRGISRRVSRSLSSCSTGATISSFN